MNEIAFASVTDLAAGFRRLTVSPVEVLGAQLQQVVRHNATLNTFTLLDEEGARRSARAAEARFLKRSPLGPLDGVTFTAKDNLMVAGYPWRRGSRATGDARAQESAPIVARCLESGAVFLGLTTMPEFGFGPVTISPLTGITRNAWNPGLQAGGSSGGAAAGLAAGFSTIAIASDAGGSIRIPAALNGVVGLKASGGRVPMFPPSVAGTLSCNGPIARTVRDAAVTLRLAAQRDVRDPFAVPGEAYDYEAGLDDGVRGWKVAVSTTLGFAPKVDPELIRAVHGVAQVLAGLGAYVEEVDPPVSDPFEAYLPLLKAGYRHSFRNFTQSQRELLSPELRDLAESQELPLAEYLAAQERCQLLARRMHEFHDQWDLLLTPTLAAQAFPAERRYPEEFEQYPNRRAWTPFTSLFNLTQQPAITLPAGLSARGLPIGVHFVCARGHEQKLLRAAHAYEIAVPFKARPPACA